MDELAAILEIGAASAELLKATSDSGGITCAITNYSKYVLLLDDVGAVAARINNSRGSGSCSTRIVLLRAVNHHAITARGYDAKFAFHFAVWDVPAVYDSESTTFQAKNRFIEERLQYAKDDAFTYVINDNNCYHIKDL